MKFSDTLWQKCAPIYKRIIEHPFNVELAEGSLDQKRFIFYISQDAYYLVAFSRALALIAGRADSSSTIHQFLNFSVGAIVVERELHANFLPLESVLDGIEPSPACMAYTQYLIATAATAPLEEAIAALLPCFWIYREVGLNIAANTAVNNPYILWIDKYSSQEFSDAVDLAISILDEKAGQCSANMLARMEKAFENSALFEWHFWDDAYQMTSFKTAYASNQLMHS